MVIRARQKPFLAQRRVDKTPRPIARIVAVTALPGLPRRRGRESRKGRPAMGLPFLSPNKSAPGSLSLPFAAFLRLDLICSLDRGNKLGISQEPLLKLGHHNSRMQNNGSVGLLNDLVDVSLVLNPAQTDPVSGVKFLNQVHRQPSRLLTRCRGSRVLQPTPHEPRHAVGVRGPNIVAWVTCIVYASSARVTQGVLTRNGTCNIGANATLPPCRTHRYASAVALNINPEPWEVLDKLYDDDLPLYDAIEDALDLILSIPDEPRIRRHQFMADPPRFAHSVPRPAGVQDWMILWQAGQLPNGATNVIVEYIGLDELINPEPAL